MLICRNLHYCNYGASTNVTYISKQIILYNEYIINSCMTTLYNLYLKQYCRVKEIISIVIIKFGNLLLL